MPNYFVYPTKRNSTFCKGVVCYVNIHVWCLFFECRLVQPRIRLLEDRNSYLFHTLCRSCKIWTGSVQNKRVCDFQSDLSWIPVLFSYQQFRFFHNATCLLTFRMQIMKCIPWNTIWTKISCFMLPVLLSCMSFINTHKYETLGQGMANPADINVTNVDESSDPRGSRSLQL